MRVVLLVGIAQLAYAARNDASPATGGTVLQLKLDGKCQGKLMRNSDRMVGVLAELSGLDPSDFEFLPGYRGVEQCEASEVDLGPESDPEERRLRWDRPDWHHGHGGSNRSEHREHHGFKGIDREGREHHGFKGGDREGREHHGFKGGDREGREHHGFKGGDREGREHHGPHGEGDGELGHHDHHGKRTHDEHEEMIKKAKDMAASMIAGIKKPVMAHILHKKGNVTELDDGSDRRLGRGGRGGRGPCDGDDGHDDGGAHDDHGERDDDDDDDGHDESGVHDDDGVHDDHDEHDVMMMQMMSSEDGNDDDDDDDDDDDGRDDGNDDDDGGDDDDDDDEDHRGGNKGWSDKKGKGDGRNGLFVSLPLGTEEKVLTALETHGADLKMRLCAMLSSDDDDECFFEINILECDARAMALLSKHAEGPSAVLISIISVLATTSFVGGVAVVYRRHKASAGRGKLPKNIIVGAKVADAPFNQWPSNTSESCREPEPESTLETDVHATATGESEP